MLFTAINICPKNDSGLCNQLYSLVTGIGFCIDKKINILFIDKFYKSINTNKYCNISSVLNIDIINLYLSKYAIFLVDSKNFTFKIESATIINDIDIELYNVTEQVNYYLKDNKFCIPSNTKLDIPKNICSENKNIYLNIKYSLNNGFFQEKYIIIDNKLTTELKYNFNELEYNVFSVVGKKHDYFWDIMVNIEFTDEFIKLADNIKSQILLGNNNSKINCIHLRLENDFIEHYSNMFKKNKNIIKVIFENEYIKTIKNHINSNEKTLILTNDFDNNVIKYLIENNYNFITIKKSYDDRELNAIIDLEVGTICNNIVVTVFESSFSYTLLYRSLKNNKMNKIKQVNLILETLL